MSNFAFLQSEWSILYGAAIKAEEMANTDARASCFYARRTLELAVGWLYKHDKSLRLPYQDHLSALIHEPSFRAAVGDAVFTKTKLIKDLGNLAVHSTRPIQRTDAITATRELFHVCYWLARTYGQRVRPAPELRFATNLIPLPAALSAMLLPLSLEVKRILNRQRMHGHMQWLSWLNCANFPLVGLCMLGMPLLIFPDMWQEHRIRCIESNFSISLKGLLCVPSHFSVLSVSP